jgi:hypothetical protein
VVGSSIDDTMKMSPHTPRMAAAGGSLALATAALMAQGCPKPQDSGGPPCIPADTAGPADSADSADTADSGETASDWDEVRCALQVVLSGGLEVAIKYDQTSRHPERCRGGGDSDEVSIQLGGPDDETVLVIAFRDDGAGTGEAFDAAVSVSTAEGAQWLTREWCCSVTIDSDEPIDQPSGLARQLEGSGQCACDATGMTDPLPAAVTISPFTFASVVTRQR